jgi:UDP-N-acetylglucosamine 2-epimerase (non-hydrolysing)
MKRVISVVGARPNFMKVAPIHRAFQKRLEKFDHAIVHTGQHYDVSMSDAFFHDLDMPNPSWFLGVGSGSHASQTSRIMVGFEKVCMEAEPDYVIVVGDVNSTIACALTSVKMGIRTAHVEAGLRSFDRTMPEEINRIATDAIVDDHFVTEPAGVENLLREGADPSTIHLVGNTMIDSMMYALPKAEASSILRDLGISKSGYAVVTLHRPSNVDVPERLEMLLNVLAEIGKRIHVVFPVHPRTQKNIELWNITTPENVRLINPIGYVDFLALLKNARFALTDSGGIQEETTVLNVPCITARTSTERPITVEIGTNVLVKPEYEFMLSAANHILDGHSRKGTAPDLWDGQASHRIVQIITSH